MTNLFSYQRSSATDKASRSPVNSILATVSTAHDLDAAHKKAAKAKALSGRRHIDGRTSPSFSARNRREPLVRFIIRLGLLVVAQIRERGRP